MGPVTREPRLLSSLEVCRRTGCTYRELTYWLEIGLVSSTVAATGSGSRRGFNEREVRWVQAVVDMRKVGLGPDAIRDALDRGRVAALLDEIVRQSKEWKRAVPNWGQEPISALA
jgi:DNA-binding transcriptional MerR regulator